MKMELIEKAFMILTGGGGISLICYILKKASWCFWNFPSVAVQFIKNDKALEDLKKYLQKKRKDH